MSTLQLTHETHIRLEATLKSVIAEKRLFIHKFPTFAVKMQPELDELESILQQLLRTPLLSQPRPDPYQKKDNAIPHYDRPKFKTAM